MKDCKVKTQELLQKISAVYLAFKRKDTPMAAKILAGITIAYALSPIDLIPDFIPVLGYLDDLIILPLLVVITVKLIPDSIMVQCSEQAKDLWKDGRPKAFRYAIPILLFWLVILVAIVYAFIK